MMPTLSDGALVVLSRIRRPQPGAVVVVGLPDGRPDAVKRVLRRDPDGWWVERDNPREGVDSWTIGPVPVEQVRGVVWLRLWPRPGSVSRRSPSSGSSPV